MQCTECRSTSISKNGKQKGKQNYICKECRRQFFGTYSPPAGYSDEFKREYLRTDVNGPGFRAIERVKGVHHTTVITWVKQVGKLLPDAYAPETIPEVGELDELETFVGSKKTKSGCGRRLTTLSQGS
jgi:hypothetical protein